MNRHLFFGVAAAALSIVCSTTLTFSQTPEALSHGPAADGSPAWFLQGVSSDAWGRGARRGISGCESDIAKYCATQTGMGVRICLSQNLAKVSGVCKTAFAAAQAESLKASGGVPPCSHSTVCDPPHDQGGNRLILKGVEWKQAPGYTVAYPDVSPEGESAGITAVAIDSKDNLWAIQRNAPGRPQLFEFSPDHKLIRTIGDDVITHQYKAHGIAVDVHDNVWICDANGSTVKELSPDGKILRTIGVRGHRGDWNEAKGQRLLWQPMMVAFAPNGDIYIGEGHAEESPNDVGSDDTTNINGAARVIHLDKNGKFINQWFGNQVGQGKFSMAHGLAVDRKTGNVYIGDREEYRIVVYTSDGRFIKTIQMRNLTCALYFDAHDQLWVATGWDGQLVRIDKESGKVLAALGSGNGQGVGQFLESPYMAMDSHGNMYAGDTTRGRITEFVAPKMKM